MIQALSVPVALTALNAWFRTRKTRRKGARKGTRKGTRRR